MLKVDAPRLTNRTIIKRSHPIGITNRSIEGMQQETATTTKAGKTTERMYSGVGMPIWMLLNNHMTITFMVVIMIPMMYAHSGGNP